MEKYRQAIKIGDNVTAMMKLPDHTYRRHV